MSERAEKALENYSIIEFGFKEITIRKKGFLDGYEQAEKDLALTWRDMVILRALFDAIDTHQSMGALKVQPMTKEYYEFLLKQYNEQKGKTL